MLALLPVDYCTCWWLYIQGRYSLILQLGLQWVCLLKWMEAKEAPETGSRSRDLVFQKLITNNHSAMLCLVTQSCPTICDPMDCRPLSSSVHGDSLGKNTGVGCHPLLQGDLPNSGFESRSPILQVDTLFSEPLVKLKNTGMGSFIPSPGDLPDPGIELGSPEFQGDSLPAELLGKPNNHSSVQLSHSVMSDSALGHARPPSPLPTSGVYSDSCPLSQ